MSKNTTTKVTPYDLINWIADSPLKPGPKSVLLALVRYVQLSENGNCVWPGQDTLVKRTMLSLRTVNGHIRELSRLGYISIYKRGKKDGYIQANGYALNFNFFHSEPFGKASKIAYGHTQKTTKSLSKIAYEGEQLKEPDIELKVEGKDSRTAPDGLCQQEGHQKKKTAGKVEDKIIFSSECSEDSFAPGFYEWDQIDDKAARAFVWHDLFADRVKGQPILRVQPLYGNNVKHEELDPDTLRLIEASKLASNYALACTKSAKARVAFWHQCGRFFYPNLPKFVASHKLSNPQSKILNRVFDELGSAACYVFAYLMANWPTDQHQKSPCLSTIEGCDSDFFYQEWRQAFVKVVLPPTQRAYKLAGERFLPDKKADFDAMYQALVLHVVEQNASADPLTSQDPDEFVFVAGPSKQQPIAEAKSA